MDRANERVVVTGVGVLSPFGLGAQTLFEGMLAGQTRVAWLEEPKRSLRPGYGAEVQEAPAKLIRGLPNSREMRPGTMTRYTFLSTCALGDAMANAAVPLVEEDGGKNVAPPWEGAKRRGAFIASYTNSDRFDKYVRFAHHVSKADGAGTVIDDAQVPEAIKKFTAFEFLKLMNNMPTAHAGIQARLQGPVNTFLGTPAGGVQAIGRARAAILDDLADHMYAGGVGSSVHDQMMMVRATRRLASSPDVAPEAAGRPFDAGGTGIVPGEGGGMLVLERYAHALARGATPLAEVAGYADWFVPPVGIRGLPPDPSGLVLAARKALAQAGIEAGDVDLVTGYGESDPHLDALEAAAHAEILGPRVAEVPVLCLTAHVGCCEAAIGPMSAALAVLAMRRGVIPGALNRQTPIAAYRGPTQAAPKAGPVRNALVTVFTREGVNAALALRAIG